MEILSITDKVRVLHAALQFSRFTVKQIAAASGVKETTVHATIGRVKDLIEEMGTVESDKPGGRALQYQLRATAREKIARESVELARTLGIPQSVEDDEVVKRTAVALGALEALTQLKNMPGQTAREASSARARIEQQVNLAKSLIALVPETQRTALENRLAKSLPENLKPTPDPASGPIDGLLPQSRAYVRDDRSPVSTGRKIGNDAGSKVPVLIIDTTLPALSGIEVLAALQSPDRDSHLYQLRVDAQAHDVIEWRSLLDVAEWPDREASVIVALNSRDEESKSLVSQLLQELDVYMWGQKEDRPQFCTQITLLDSGLDTGLLKANLAHHNVNYFPQLQGSGDFVQIVQVIASQNAAGKFVG